MKHPLSVTLFLLFFFLVAQLIGLVVSYYYKVNDLPFSIDRPEPGGLGSVVVVFLLLILISGFVLFLFKFEKYSAWGFLYFFSLVLAVAVTLYPLMGSVALLVSLVVVLLKVNSGDSVFSNSVETLVYPGVVPLISSLFTPLTAVLLLVLVSLYDFFGVKVSRHIIVLADEQRRSNLFAGFSVRKGRGGEAVLGGGDVAFPLIFASTLPLVNGLITVLSVSASLAGLLFLSKKGEYYPAMPFLTIGCLIGYFSFLLLSF